MKRRYRQLAVVMVVLSCALSTRAGILDKLGTVLTNSTASATNSGTSSSALNGLSQDQLVGGLKQALSNGLQHAVGQLGHEGGFLTNLNVKIPMPERLKLVEKTLRS